jgi:hypothetical protein
VRISEQANRRMRHCELWQMSLFCRACGLR